MKTIRINQVPLLFFACVMLAAVAWGQIALEFSAEVVTTSVAPARGGAPVGAVAPGGRGGRGPQRTKIYVAPGFLRTDGLDRGHVMSNVQDFARQKNIQMVPDQGWYNETDLKAGRGGRGPDLRQYDLSNPCVGLEGISCTKIATDAVDGRNCDSWEFTDADGKKSTVCVDQQIRLALRKVADGRTVELVNIKLGKQDPNLFKPGPDLKPGGVDDELMKESQEEVRQHELLKQKQGGHQ